MLDPRGARTTIDEWEAPKPGRAVRRAGSSNRAMLMASALVGLPAIVASLFQASHLAGWLDPMHAVLVPLILPQAEASIRRALRGASVDGASNEPTEAPVSVYSELRDLRAAYDELKQDVAERGYDADRLNYLAHHDALTDLPNRVLLMDRLTQALTFARRAGSSVLVLFVDLDRFKTINDTLGHAAGDRVLVEVAHRIAGCMRGADTASRVGGDEFVLVCSAADGISDAPRLATRILGALAAPIDVFGTPVTVGASVGISIAPDDAMDAEELIAKADSAMYCAKSRGRNCYHVYTPEIQAEIEREAQLERELRVAIAADQFEVHYQPIVDLGSGAINGAEALVRWRHPVRGLLAPREFIPFAEQRGLGADIGACVMRAVCSQLKRFALAASDDFSISINVSADQFRRAEFVQSVAEAIALHAADPRRLSIEVAEAMMASDSRSAILTLYELGALGVQLAIDDFGIGAGSLAAMKFLPVQKLKIDSSFVQNITGNPGDEAIARTIVTLAHGLGMRVIAEGVETDEQAQKLRALGSDSLQGFLISRPLPAAEFERFACTYGSLRLAA